MTSFVGLGAGDLMLTTETIHIPNVLLVDRRMRAIERFIGVKPDQVRANIE